MNNPVEKNTKLLKYRHDYVINHTHNTALSFTDYDGFHEWLNLQMFSKHYILSIITYFRKKLYKKTFNSPMELQKYIQSKITAYNSISKSARVYLNFCEKTEKMPIEVITKYRAFLKLKRSNYSFYVPTDDELIRNFTIIKKDKNLKLVFIVMATSGIRYVECLDFLKKYDSSKFSVHSNFVSYNVSELRNTKNINNIYLPLFVYHKLEHINEEYNSLLKSATRLKRVFSFKYLRKWQYNFLLYNNVPESVADFIQGRSSKSVSANHYLSRAQQANFWYTKVADKLKSILEHNNTPKTKNKANSRNTIRSDIKKRMNYSGG